MRGETLLKALNDVDLEMVEKAAEYKADADSPRKYFCRQVIKYAVCAIVFVMAGLVIGDKMHQQKPAEQVTCVPLYTRSEDSFKVYYLTAKQAEKSELEDYGYPYIDSSGDVFQLNLSAIKGFSDSFSGQQKGKVNCSQRLTEAFGAAKKKLEAGEVKEEKIRYLVELVISETALQELEGGSTVEIYQSVNDEVMKAEYERLTKEYGYELIWIPKGGYLVAEDYWYYLENGGIYGTLTEEQIKNLPPKEEYAYVFWLTCQESLEYTKCVYKEVCKQEELYRAQQIAMEALRQLEVEE